MNHSEISEHQTGFEIAIIGMAGRFPGANKVAEFWQNLRDGMESISFFSDEELLAAGVDSALINEDNYVKAKGVIDDIETFDASFFGYTPREAQIMDPQHRFFLEQSWAALEDAGYTAENYTGAIGVYAGTGMNHYLLNNLYSNPDILESLVRMQISIGNNKDSLATRVAYKFNLKGPAVVIQTACSTSLVAVHLACQGLLSGECDMALSGGITLRVPNKAGYLYQEGGTTSPDGHCRAFDAKAQGMVGGSGIGIVVLKRLEDALEDGDNIYAVIKGSAINNDGSLKVGYTAPSVEGQAEAITKALLMAEVDPETVSYIETHGTGTILGDPIEIAALTQAYRAYTDKKGFCAIGSVKTNIGHLDVAAGVAGLIKTSLALKHKELPPSLHFEQPNPEIDFANSPFYVNKTLSTWETTKYPRRAGVSAFGIGGTNAHLVLEEAPSQEASGDSRPHQLLVLSAKTSAALETATTNLVEYFKKTPDLNLADAAHTLQVGRKSFGHRRMLVCQDLNDAITALETNDSGRVITTGPQPNDRPVAFMFPGQGAQYVNMGLELYQVEPTFREQVDLCVDLLKPHLGFDLRDVLYPKLEEDEAAKQLKQTIVAQSAIFVMEYAWAKLWMEWGIQPRYMIGHSIGEYVAACLAGVFSLEDALALVAIRGQLMQELPGGAMMAVTLSEEEIRPLLGDNLYLAAINGPSLCVVSGPTNAVDTLENRLTEQNVGCRRLHTSHAFHSAMMDPILQPFTERVSKVNLTTPEIPFISSVTGTWITAAEATDPSYWAQHVRQTVRFADGVSELFNQPDAILLEVGPGQTLGSLVKRHPERVKEQVVLSSSRHPFKSQSDVAFLLNALGQLWLSGLDIDWSGFYGNERRYRLSLPTYPFERRRYWVDPQKQANGNMPHYKSSRRKPDIADWFYLPSWKRSASPILFESDRLADQKLCWLVFVDRQGLGAQVMGRLEQIGQDILAVTAGDQFAQLSNFEYTINPQKRDDYETLIKTLREQDKIPNIVVHLWAVGPNDDTVSEFAHLDKAQDLGFYSLLFFAQAIGNQHITDSIQVAVATSNVQEVTGGEVLFPERSTVLGPCKVIPQEYQNITCRGIDLVVPESGVWEEAEIDHLIAEFVSKSPDTIVAYRRNHRWVQTFEPVRLDNKNGCPIRLREEGTYLITGGLGGIGLEIAEYLARTVRARLVLIGRSKLPPRDEWEQWLATRDDQDGVSQKIQKIQALEKLGVEVLVASANVANSEQMQAVINQTYERFGQIHGVIHAAGVAGGGIIQLKDPETAASVLESKVRGTQVLHTIFKDTKLDFLVLCSSLTSVLGGFGQVDYCAANTFLDTFAHYHNSKQDTFTVAINWTAWQEVGMAVNTEIPAELKERREDSLKKGLSSKEGLDVLSRILHSSLPQVLVSTYDLKARIDERNHNVMPQNGPEVEEEAHASDSGHARPELSNDYVAPRNEIEKTVADIWQILFGIEQVGVHDDFFQLGGHSLLATQLLNKLQKTYNRTKLSLRDLFDHPTIASFASLIEKTNSQGTSSADRPIREVVLAAFPTERNGLIETYLKNKISQALGIEVEQIPKNGNLADFDLEVIIPSLVWDLKRDFQLPVYPQEILERPSIEMLTEFISIELESMSKLETMESTSLLSLDDHKPARKREVKRRLPESEEKNQRMIFLLSAPRSGSTLLRLMLAGHSALFCPPELALLSYDSMNEWGRNRPSLFSREGLVLALMELMNIDFDECKALVDDFKQQDMPIQEVYRLVQQKAGSRILVDKSPSYTRSIDTLQRAEELFKEPKYIHLVRHPYAVIESIVRNRFHKLFGEDNVVDPYMFAEEVWITRNRNTLDFLSGVRPDRYHLIHFEKLVREPVEVMRGLCQFLGLPFEEAVLHPYEKGRLIDGPGDPGIFQHDKIDPALGTVWKTITLPRQLSEYSQRLADELNYELPAENPVYKQNVEKPKISSGNREDVQQLPTDLDQLSDAEVDSLLKKILADRKDEK